MKTYLKAVTLIFGAIICLGVVGPMLISHPSYEGLAAGILVVVVFFGAAIYSITKMLKGANNETTE